MHVIYHIYIIIHEIALINTENSSILDHSSIFHCCRFHREHHYYNPWFIHERCDVTDTLFSLVIWIILWSVIGRSYLSSQLQWKCQDSNGVDRIFSSDTPKVKLYRRCVKCLSLIVSLSYVELSGLSEWLTLLNYSIVDNVFL